MSAKSNKWKLENGFFINHKTGRRQYHKQCQYCPHECKQSFRVEIIQCKLYDAITKERKENKGVTHI